MFLQYPEYHTNKGTKNELQTAFQKPIANIIIKSNLITLVLWMIFFKIQIQTSGFKRTCLTKEMYYMINVFEFEIK